MKTYFNREDVTLGAYGNVNNKSVPRNTKAYFNKEEAKDAGKKKLTEYCIIDHIGSIDNKTVVNKAYATATQLSKYPKQTYKIKEFCRLLIGNPYEEPSAKLKNYVRFHKHPQQVILIIPMAQGYWDIHKKEFTWDEHQDYDRISSKNMWWAETWAERAESVTIIACGENDIEVLDMQEQHPEWFSCKEPVDSVYRRCSNIWGAALGWHFSAPLYRDVTSEIDVMKYRRNDAKALTAAPGAHVTKTSHSPKVYLNSKAVASEKECQEFFELYKYLYTEGMLQESLAEGYQLCPECGRPIRLEKNSFHITEDWKPEMAGIPEHPNDKCCEHCGKFRIPAKYLSEVERYWDDSFKEDEE